jgi:hypothetical protein
MIEAPCGKLQGISILKVETLSYSLANPQQAVGNALTQEFISFIF